MMHDDQVPMFERAGMYCLNVIRHQFQRRLNASLIVLTQATLTKMNLRIDPVRYRGYGSAPYVTLAGLSVQFPC